MDETIATDTAAPAKAAAPTPVPATEPVLAKPITAKPAAKVRAVKVKTVKAEAVKSTPTKPAAAPAKIKVAKSKVATAPTKETRTMTTQTTEITEKFQAAIKDASDKAKAAFEKSQSQFAQAGEFTKGNVEALVESSKILASGLQELGKGYFSDSKSAFETLTAEIKDLTKVKTPAELLEKQTALLRKQFDAAVAASSKNSEAMLKLANEAFQPISTRVSVAVEKIKQAA